MIARLWRGQATNAQADAYFRHVTGTVFPSLKDLAGYRGAWLLRRQAEGQTEFLALTHWESHDTIPAFSGDHNSTAHLEPEAPPLLADFDDFARHYEVAFKTP